jgi:hypothetical protein
MALRQPYVRGVKFILINKRYFVITIVRLKYLDYL